MLDSTEKNTFSGSTFEETVVHIKDLDQLHNSSSKLRRLSSRIQPFLHFLDRHARALDSMVQVYPNPSALIWGMLRMILEV